MQEKEADTTIGYDIIKLWIIHDSLWISSAINKISKALWSDMEIYFAYIYSMTYVKWLYLELASSFSILRSFIMQKRKDEWNVHQDILYWLLLEI